MSKRTIPLTDALYDYMLAHGTREHEILRRIRRETSVHPEAEMQIAPEQGQLMALLVRLIGARRALEIGVFTGYSSTAIALALPEDGHLTACDVSEEYTRAARAYWEAAGVSNKVELRVGPALETLANILAESRAKPDALRYDFVFIDADKENYDRYYEGALALTRAGGLIVFDNVFRGGKVADPDLHDPGTMAIRALNDKLHGDTRVEICMLPVADGVTLAMKR